MSEIDPMAVQREKRIRRAILRVLNAARPSGLSGRNLRDVLEGQPDGIADDRELLSLCQDLVSLGYATTTDIRKLRSQQATAATWVYAITAMGTALLAGQVAVSPLVDDERL